MKRLFYALLILFSIVSILSQKVSGQSVIKKGFKLGPELGRSLTENTGSFKRSLGFFGGVFTAIHLYEIDNSTSIILKTELNALQLQYYKVNEKHLNWDQVEALFDVKYSFTFFEIGFIPAYQLKLNDDYLLEIFLGPSSGIGTAGLDLVHLNNVEIYDPWDEYTDGFNLNFDLNAGITFYYQALLLDLRYSLTSIVDNRKHDKLNNIYLLIGVGF